MAVRTYQIGLYAVFNTAHRYATRWRVKLEAGMTDPQKACLAAVIEALAECLPLIAPPAPVE